MLTCVGWQVTPIRVSVRRPISLSNHSFIMWRRGVLPKMDVANLMGGAIA